MLDSNTSSTLGQATKAERSGLCALFVDDTVTGATSLMEAWSRTNHLRGYDHVQDRVETSALLLLTHERRDWVYLKWKLTLFRIRKLTLSCDGRTMTITPTISADSVVSLSWPHVCRKRTNFWISGYMMVSAGMPIFFSSLPACVFIHAAQPAVKSQVSWKRFSCRRRGKLDAQQRGWRHEIVDITGHADKEGYWEPYNNSCSTMPHHLVLWAL